MSAPPPSQGCFVREKYRPRDGKYKGRIIHELSIGDRTDIASMLSKFRKMRLCFIQLKIRDEYIYKEMVVCMVFILHNCVSV